MGTGYWELKKGNWKTPCYENWFLNEKSFNGRRWNSLSVFKSQSASRELIFSKWPYIPP
jgi:hypothetical protein